MVRGRITHGFLLMDGTASCEIVYCGELFPGSTAASTSHALVIGLLVMPNRRSGTAFTTFLMPLLETVS